MASSRPLDQILCLLDASLRNLELTVLCYGDRSIGLYLRT